MLPVLIKLKREFPELEIEVNRCMTVESTIDDAFNKKLYDFAFVHIGVQPLYTKRIQLWKQPMVWVAARGLPLEQAIKLLTSTPAELLGKAGVKGCVAVGADADLLVLDAALDIDSLFAKGQTAILNKEIILKGCFE